MTQDRNLVAVIDRVIAHIPLEEAALIARLLANRESVCYTAPEVMGMRWREVAETLEAYIGVPDQEWQYEVCSTFSLQPITVIKEWADNERKRTN